MVAASSMYEFSETKAISFRCGTCEREAEVVAHDGELQSVSCGLCGARLDGVDAREMHRELSRQYTIQKARNLSRRLIAERGMGSAPLSQVGDTFSDPAWPFILVFVPDE